MIQFYFLSVLLNFLAGYSLALDPEVKNSPLDGIRSLLLDETTRLVLGIFTGSVGFFKLLTVVRGDIPVVGDLIPAVAGMIAGFALVLEYYRSRSTTPSEASERLNQILVKNRKWVGIGAILSAAAHFLFPMVLFL